MYYTYGQSGPSLLIESTIDIMDCVNGIGNCSRELYFYINDGCALCVIVEVDGFVELYAL